MKIQTRAIMKSIKSVVIAIWWTLIFLALFIPNATAFWNPNL